jgi:hypothetical protein
MAGNAALLALVSADLASVSGDFSAVFRWLFQRFFCWFCVGFVAELA